MSFDLATLKTNKKSERDGVWVDYLGGSRLLVARTNNARYRAFVSTKYKQHRMIIDRGGVGADELAEKIQIEAVARYILLGWENVDVDGKSQEYNWELGMKALTEFSDFKADVDTFSHDTDLYSAHAHQDDCDELKK